MQEALKDTLWEPLLWVHNERWKLLVAKCNKGPSDNNGNNCSVPNLYIEGMLRCLANHWCLPAWGQRMAG